jgi:hypothetical protein
MTCEQLGDLAHLNKGTISRIEAGLSVPDRHFAEVCAATFKNEWYIRFWNDSQSWDATYPAQFRKFSEYEAEARQLWIFEHIQVPGLFQTESYARAVLRRHPHVTPEEVNERLQGRIARQKILARDEPPIITALLDENVLRRQIGDPKLMAEQFSLMAELAERPRITIQLLAGDDAHVGLQGAVNIAETDNAVVLNLDDFNDGRTTDNPIAVAQALDRFDSLRADAYRRTESLAMIQEAAERCSK